MLPDFKQDNPEFSSVDSYVLKDAVTNLRVAFSRRKYGSGFPRLDRSSVVDIISRQCLV